MCVRYTQNELAVHASALSSQSQPATREDNLAASLKRKRSASRVVGKCVLNAKLFHLPLFFGENPFINQQKKIANEKKKGENEKGKLDFITLFATWPEK